MELDTGGNAFAFSPSPVLPIVTVISFSTFAVNNVHLYQSIVNILNNKMQNKKQKKMVDNVKAMTLVVH